MGQKYLIEFESDPIGKVERLPERLASIGLTPTGVEYECEYTGAGVAPDVSYVSSLTAEYGGKASDASNQDSQQDSGSGPDAPGKA